jgi:hypothetical protein
MALLKEDFIEETTTVQQRLNILQAAFRLQHVDHQLLSMTAYLVKNDKFTNLA